MVQSSLASVWVVQCSMPQSSMPQSSVSQSSVPQCSGHQVINVHIQSFQLVLLPYLPWGCQVCGNLLLLPLRSGHPSRHEALHTLQRPVRLLPPQPPDGCHTQVGEPETGAGLCHGTAQYNGVLILTYSTVLSHSILCTGIPGPWQANEFKGTPDQRDERNHGKKAVFSVDPLNNTEAVPEVHRGRGNTMYVVWRWLLFAFFTTRTLRCSGTNQMRTISLQKIGRKQTIHCHSFKAINVHIKNILYRHSRQNLCLWQFMLCNVYIKFQVLYSQTWLLLLLLYLPTLSPPQHFLWDLFLLFLLSPTPWYAWRLHD